MFAVCFFFMKVISPTTLFLAAKVEEQPRKLEHVIKVSHACLNPQEPPLDTKSNVSCAVGHQHLDLPHPSYGIPVFYRLFPLAVLITMATNEDLNFTALAYHYTHLSSMSPFAPSSWPFKLGYRWLHRLLDSLQICCNDCLSNFRHTSSKLKSW